jgi:ribosomal-protein-alanine N-acetyltransferase
VINLNHIVRGTFQNASLGYYVGLPYQGNGYMQQGLEQLMRLAFTTLGLHRLEANIQPDNERSKKLVEACGFHCEGLSEGFLFIDGQWRDHERWSACADRDTLRP